MMRMSKAQGEINVTKFLLWRDALINKGYSAFKPFANSGSLNRSKVSRESGVDLNALKVGKGKGNPTVLFHYDELEETLQKKLPDYFTVKKSALEQYQDYIEELEKTGGKFPVDEENDLDFIRLAKDIGFPIARLNSPNIKKLLNDDMSRIGTKVVVGKTVQEMMESNLISSNSELSKCRKDLAIAEEKNDSLTKQNLQLQSENRKLKQQSTEKEESLEHTIESGRRFTL